MQISVSRPALSAFEEPASPADAGASSAGETAAREPFLACLPASGFLPPRHPVRGRVLLLLGGKFPLRTEGLGHACPGLAQPWLFLTEQNVS